MCSEKKVRPIDKVPCHDGTTLKFVSRKFTEEDEKMINDFLGGMYGSQGDNGETFGDTVEGRGATRKSQS